MLGIYLTVVAVDKSDATLLLLSSATRGSVVPLLGRSGIFGLLRRCTSFGRMPEDFSIGSGGVTDIASGSWALLVERLYICEKSPSRSVKSRLLLLYCPNMLGPANCRAGVDDSLRWRMSIFSAASGTYVGETLLFWAVSVSFWLFCLP